MNDVKNIFIAWLSAGSPLLAAAASETGVTLLSAIVLPVLFFAIGKTIDVMLQIYLTGRNTNGSECAPQPETIPAGRKASVNGDASSSSSSPSVVGLNLAARNRTTEKEAQEERSDNR
ncbi:MAG: hypothetical protein HOP17_09090 [Acidobacteria bacterium]|nr:hypothetical protein [Acidobacteriota bacterium]